MRFNGMKDSMVRTGNVVNFVTDAMNSSTARLWSIMHDPYSDPKGICVKEGGKILRYWIVITIPPPRRTTDFWMKWAWAAWLPWHCVEIPTIRDTYAYELGTCDHGTYSLLRGLGRFPDIFQMGMCWEIFKFPTVLGTCKLRDAVPTVSKPIPNCAKGSAGEKYCLEILKFPRTEEVYSPQSCEIAVL